MNLKKLRNKLNNKDIQQVHNLRHHGDCEPGFEKEETRNNWEEFNDIAEHLFGVPSNEDKTN